MAYARLPFLLGKALIGMIKVILTQKITHCITNMTGVTVSGHHWPPCLL